MELSGGSPTSQAAACEAAGAILTAVGGKTQLAPPPLSNGRAGWSKALSIIQLSRLKFVELRSKISRRGLDFHALFAPRSLHTICALSRWPPGPF